MRRENKTKNIIIFTIIVPLIVTGCAVASFSTDATVTPDLQGTLSALNQESAQGSSAHGPQPLPDDGFIQATITPTVYVPEGQLFFYNFEEVPVGTEVERHPGIIFRKPEFGFEIGLTGENDYYLGAGLTGEPDGNISVYALNLSPPADTTAMIGCRAESGDSGDGKPALENGYVVEFRFDGAAQLKKIQDGSATVIAGRDGITRNSEGVYNQLYLLCDGTRLLFMVNANVVFDMSDSTLAVGDFIVGVKSNISIPETTVRFDKIAVFEP